MKIPAVQPAAPASTLAPAPVSPAMPQMSPLMGALSQFDAVEANLTKLERMWEEMQKLIPGGVVFTENPTYEDYHRSFDLVLAALPKIDGWLPEIQLFDLNDIAQMRMDAQECGFFEAGVSTENSIWAPGRALREYRFRFNQKRRALIRDALRELIDYVDVDIRDMKREIPLDLPVNTRISDSPRWQSLRARVDQIETLLGSSVPRPQGWGELRRHLSWGQVCDLHDIENSDWPTVKGALSKGVYEANEPIPVQVQDLGDLVATKPAGPVVTKLNWEKLTPETFERLIFSLISNQPGYENPEWFMHTNAPDKGRDLSVTRVMSDELTGTIRGRVILQCKHWRTKSISVEDVATLEAQMKLWEPPRVDVCIIATSGRFSADAVAWIERHNQSDKSLRIEMWPESHLERLLAQRPGFIAEFGLR